MKLGLIQLGGSDPKIRIPWPGQDADTATSWMLHEDMMSWQFIASGALVRPTPNSGSYWAQTVSFPDFGYVPKVIIWTRNSAYNTKPQNPHPRGWTFNSYNAGHIPSDRYIADWSFRISSSALNVEVASGNKYTYTLQYLLFRGEE